MEIIVPVKNMPCRTIMMRRRRFRFTCLTCVLIIPTVAISGLIIQHLLHESRDLRTIPTEAFIDKVTEYADDTRTILLSYVEYGYIEMALNFYLSSLERFRIINYLFISTDNESCETLEDKFIHCLVVNETMIDFGQPSNYGSVGFNTKTNFKIKLVLSVLKEHFTVLFADLDIVFLKNPIPLIKLQFAEADIIFQSNSPKPVEKANTGFYLARPTSSSVMLFTKVWNVVSSDVGKRKNDQEVMIDVIKTQKQSIKVRYLDQTKYPAGLGYWEEEKRMFQYTDPWLNPLQIIVHNNWVVSKAAKIYRFKESQMWKYDSRGYYSNLGKYITYSNPYDGNGTTVRKLETSALLNAFSIGYLLNRSVILPAFHCYGCISKACRVSDNMCNLMAHFQISELDKYFGNQYREHVFLNNSLTPSSVKQSVSNTILIASSFAKRFLPNKAIVMDRNLDIFQPQNKLSGASVDEIRIWFGNYNTRVLNFHSLYDAFEGFPDVPVYSGIRNRLQNAIKPTDYRQFGMSKATV